MVPLARMGSPVRITHGPSSCRKAQTSYKTKLFAKVLHLFSPQKSDRLVICYENGDDAMKNPLSTIRKKLSLKKALPGVALGLITSCSPSHEDIQKMINDVPQQQQHSLVINYDKTLLRNIDSLTNSGFTLEDAIEKSHSITWRQALTKMPLKKSEWIGENWIVRNEAEKQLKASREQKTRSVMKLMPKSNGKTTTFVQMPMSETYYIYNPEYRNKLINEIKNKETSLKTSKSDLKLDLPKLKNIQKQNY